MEVAVDGIGGQVEELMPVLNGVVQACIEYIVCRVMHWKAVGKLFLRLAVSFLCLF